MTENELRAAAKILQAAIDRARELLKLESDHPLVIAHAREQAKKAQRAPKLRLIKGGLFVVENHRK